MFQIAIRGLRQHPFRYVATALAIILGVTFFTGTSVVTRSFRETINDSIAEAFADVDAVVRSSDVIETPFGDLRPQIPFDLTESIRQVDGVSDAAPFLTGYAQIVGSDGKTLGGGGGSPPQGFAWLGDSELNPYELTGSDSRAPETPFEVLIDEATLDDAGYAVGDAVRVLPMPEDQLYTIVGTIDSVSDNDFGGQVLAFSFEGAGLIFGTTDVDQIIVGEDTGVSDQELAERLNAAIASGELTTASGAVDTGLEAITGAEFAEEIQDLIGTFVTIIDTALKVFAAIALFVGAFVIYNTFSITVAQRQQEMALLRAIGASVRQVSRSVLLESVIVGAIASFLGALGGIGLGYGLIKLLEQLADDFAINLSVPPGTLVGGVILGTIITILAAWLPARRGARVPPVQAMRETAVEDPTPSRTRGTVGLALLAGGVVLTLLPTLSDGSAALFGLGVVVLVVGVVVAGPIIVRPMSKVIAIPFVRGGSIIGELARENSARNPKRSATTSLTLMIGVALVVTATVFAATLRESIRGELEDQMIGDYVVEISPEIAAVGGGLDPAIAAQVATVPGVAASVPSRNTTGEIDGDFVQLQGLATAQTTDVFRFETLEGTVTDLGSGDIAVSSDAADDRGLAIGDTVNVKLQQSSVDLTVAGIFDPPGALSSWVVDTAVLDEHTLSRLDSTIFIATEEGAGDDTVAAVDQVLAADPTARVETTADYIDDQAGSINQLLILLYGLLAMSVLVALIGIVNTMALSIHERTRELGLLRAVGMTTRQLRRTIRYESTIIALIGTFVGMLLGVFFGWLVSKATEDVFPEFTVPWVSLLVIALVGVVAGFLSGVLPARRAGKLDVLDAIAGE